MEGDRNVTKTKTLYLAECPECGGRPTVYSLHRVRKDKPRECAIACTECRRGGFMPYSREPIEVLAERWNAHAGQGAQLVPVTINLVDGIVTLDG